MKADRTPYPFHNQSPRVAPCCYYKRAPVRKTWLQRVLSRLFN
jgi:hypothetical protein